MSALRAWCWLWAILGAVVACGLCYEGYAGWGVVMGVAAFVGLLAGWYER